MQCTYLVLLEARLWPLAHEEAFSGMCLAVSHAWLPSPLMVGHPFAHRFGVLVFWVCPWW